ncbi:MAG TPA: hypothetical protein HA308_02090 [Candidatus Thalassarchaeaceae archaeon]|nr:MAG TPA: hypothetical protein D7H82_02085 [Candidatus Poseidoniales archaeon]HII33673.1 hypothetical protein [Candidatus Thalassarchaeaceae archaeon]
MEDALARVEWIGRRDMAEALLKSIQPDDPDSFKSEIIEIGDKVRLSIVVSSAELGQMRATMDDILACLSAVEGSLGVLEE